MQFKKNITYRYLVLIIVCLGFVIQTNNSFTMEFSTNTNFIYYHISNGTLIDYNNTVIANKNIQISDTLEEKEKVLKIWQEVDKFNIKVNLQIEVPRLKLTAVNMLGKEVLQIYDGVPKPKNFQYTFDANLLPAGIYVCILTAAGLREAEKFIVTK